jgi:hypothetical protein
VQHFTRCIEALPVRSTLLAALQPISTNNRTNLPQITEKSAFPLDEKQAVTSKSNSSYTLQVKYIAAVAF